MRISDWSSDVCSSDLDQLAKMVQRLQRAETRVGAIGMGEGERGHVGSRAESHYIQSITTDINVNTSLQRPAKRWTVRRSRRSVAATQQGKDHGRIAAADAVSEP